jgi:hypothetical protein
MWVVMQVESRGGGDQGESMASAPRHCQGGAGRRLCDAGGVSCRRLASFPRVEGIKESLGHLSSNSSPRLCRGALFTSAVHTHALFAPLSLSLCATLSLSDFKHLGNSSPVSSCRFPPPQGPKDHGVPGLLNFFGIGSPGLTSSLSLAERATELLAKSKAASRGG